MDDQVAPEVEPRRRGKVLGIALAIGALLLAVLALSYAWLQSDSGRGYAASRIAGMEFKNGLKIGVKRIEGSLFGQLRLVGVTASDPQGVFLTSPEIMLDWRPFALASNHVDIHSLRLESADWLRMPHFRPSAEDQPLLPDIDIDIDRFEARRIRVAAAVTGLPHVLSLSGKAHIADRRAQVEAHARAINAKGIAGGDRFDLLLDAVPDTNRLALDARLDAPAGGLVAGLAGLSQPVALALKGKGDWQSWRGRLSAQSATARIADLDLAARNGSFAVKGPLRPGLLVPLSARNMLMPVTQIDLRAVAQDRRLALSGGASNANFTLGVSGIADLAQSAWHDFGLAFRLTQPRTLAARLSGSEVTARATLDGSFAAPRIAYALNAASLGFGTTVMEGLSVSGSARLDKDHWRIPVSGRLRGMRGVNSSLAPLLANLRLNGDLAYANGRVLSDNIHLLSDRIDAMAIVVADLDKGFYTGGLQGRVNGYRVESVGIFNLDTQMDIKPGAGDYFRLAGRITARSTRLEGGIESFLGGDALIAADVGYDSNGLATVDRVTVTAPAFRLASGRGEYRPDGSIRFAGRGTSNAYGPLAVAVTGTAADPVARITASRPGFGVGLADVTAIVRRRGDGIFIQGEGESAYGPVTAHVQARQRPAGLALEVLPGSHFSGVGLTGSLTRTPAGPFAGALLAGGAGVEGRVQLSSSQGHQRIVAHLAADHAELPGRIGLWADRALADADMVLYDRPQVVADVQLAGARIGRLQIAGARGKINYRAGTGTAQLLMEGRTRYPFRIAVNAALQPELWRVAMKGRFNGIDIATRGPLRIEPERAGYVLRTSVIETGNGSVALEGRYGPGIVIHSRLNAVNLALADPFMPGLGLGGSATGSLDFTQANPSAFPSADARLQLQDFTRTTLASQSLPVDIHLVGRLLPDGGTAGVVIRRRGAVVGRMQLGLRPLGPGAGSWTTRLLAAPLSGGMRYNGPADALFSLAALPDQSLKGPIGVAADFTGRVNAPQLTGLVRANNLTYDNGRYGTRLTRMQLSGKFTNDRLEVEKLTAKAGEGTVSGKGFVSLSSRQGFPAQLGLDLSRARVAAGHGLSSVATGNIEVVNSPETGSVIKGTLKLPETHYRIVRQGSAQIARLTGVRRKPALSRERITGSPEEAMALPAHWKLDVDLKADNRVFVTGMGLNSEWAADLHAGGTTDAPELTGGVTLVRGTLGFAGRSFELTEGRLTFAGNGMSPTLHVVATADVEGVATTITVTGSSLDPQFAFTSTPSLPRDELMARILFGNSVGQLSAIQAVQLAASLNNLRGSKGGLNPLGVLQSSAGIDRLRILDADKATGRQTSVAVGKYISNDIYIELVTDARGYTATQLEVSLTRALSVLSKMSSFGGSSVGLRYRKDY